MHPALRTWRDDISAAFVRALACACGLAVLSILAARMAQPPTPGVAIEPAPRAQWIEVERPHPAFALGIPEAGDAPAQYSIRRHEHGGGRKDILSLGQPDNDAPYLRVEIYRPGRESSRFAEPGPKLAGDAAALGARELSLGHEPLNSKFGTLSVATFKTGHVVPRWCVGFMRAYDEPRLQISGRFCQGGERFVARETLACALDRLSLLAAGSDPKVGELFAQAELKRTFCGQRSPLLAPTPRHQALWARSAQKAEPDAARR